MNGLNYPTEEQLDKIRNWQGKDFDEFMRYLKSIWTWPEYFRETENAYYVSTGGWSGNEEILSVWQESEISDFPHLFWLFYWYQSKRGGHYIFEKFGKDVEKDEFQTL